MKNTLSYKLICHSKHKNIFLPIAEFDMLTH